MAIRWRPPVAAAIAVAPSVVVEIFFEWQFAGVMRTRRLDLLWHNILICESVGRVGIGRIGKGKWNGNIEDKVTGIFFLQNKVKNPTAKRGLKKLTHQQLRPAVSASERSGSRLHTANRKDSTDPNCYH
ncbi:hypothetical protein C4D60_Mb07t22940 [Musa balbisiana]|uniref:Uncharacterized protein n=1 Tax=Musa balbisiana TaxID=52838 RepID=A0A4S8JI28_MUSBA|nr:hypothetical protein C4D60_Mb07t22940 [Musa balbisiana]